MQSKEYKLKYPVQRGTETVENVTIEKPRAKHMRGIKNASDLDSQLVIIGRLINQPPSFVDNIDMEDIAGIAEVVADFLPDSQSVKD